MSTFESEKEEFLEHYGKKGMRWGKRTNPNYSDQQVRRDSQVYGNRGASRINKALNKGDQISTARGDEKTRRDRVMSKNKYVRQGGKVAGALASVAVANVALTGLSRAATSTVGRNIINKFLTSNHPLRQAQVAIGLSEALRSPQVRVMVSTGAAAVSQMFAGDAAVAVNMRAHGYDPNRK